MLIELEKIVNYSICHNYVYSNLVDVVVPCYSVSNHSNLLW